MCEYASEYVAQEINLKIAIKTKVMFIKERREKLKEYKTFCVDSQIKNQVYNEIIAVNNKVEEFAFVLKVASKTYDSSLADEWYEKSSFFNLVKDINDDLKVTIGKVKENWDSRFVENIFNMLEIIYDKLMVVYDNRAGAELLGIILSEKERTYEEVIDNSKEIIGYNSLLAEDYITSHEEFSVIEKLYEYSKILNNIDYSTFYSHSFNAIPFISKINNILGVFLTELNKVEEIEDKALVNAIIYYLYRCVKSCDILIKAINEL